MTLSEAKLELKSARLNGGSAVVLRKIRRISGTHGQLLKLRYIDNMSWKQISEVMEYSADHLRGYMNRKAIEKYAEL